MIRRLGNDKDKFGYYRVDEYRTYSKVEAIELAHRQNRKWIDWHFNDLEFSAYDWTQEPTQSLPQLYAQRAQQIRDTYDHVVLFYSGGSDSTNMLDAFVDNDIAFDEIVTLGYWDIDPDPNSHFHSELVQVAWPRIKHLQSQGLKFRHRHVDLGRTSVNLLSDSSMTLDRPYLATTIFTTNHLSKSYIRETTPDYLRITDSGQRLVFVFGHDKPRLFKVNDRYCVRFLDTVDHAVPVRTQLQNRSWEYDECFYQAPECCDLICKQAHVLLKFFRANPLLFDEKKYYSDTVPDSSALNNFFGNAYFFTRPINARLGESSGKPMTYRRMLNRLLYHTWDPNSHDAGKHPGLIYGPRDQCITDKQYLNSHLEAIAQHFRQLPPHWLNDTNDPNRGLVGCLSRPYFLE